MPIRIEPMRKKNSGSRPIRSPISVCSCCLPACLTKLISKPRIQPSFVPLPMRCAWPIDPVVSPRMDLNKQPDAIEKIMLSNQRIVRMEDRPVDMLQPREENPRVQQIARKSRFAYDEKGDPISKTEFSNCVTRCLRPFWINFMRILLW